MFGSFIVLLESIFLHDIMFRAPIWPIAQGNEEENPDKDKYGLFMVLVIGMLTTVYRLAILRV